DVEAAVMQDPLFEQVMLVGEARPYLVLLAVTRENDEQVLLRKTGERMKHLPRYARIRRVIPIGDPWTSENGLLTPTLKVKRSAVYERYRDRIEAAYRE